MHKEVRVVFLRKLLCAIFLSAVFLLSACFHSENHPPTANAIVSNLTPSVGEVVIFDGSLSSDVDGDKLSYEWEIITRPVDSQAQLSDPNASNPTMPIDRDGAYQIQLIVSDRKLKSKADFVNLATVNLKPKAVVKTTTETTAGGFYVAGDVIELDASESFDPENQNLFYRWELVSRPPNSQAFLTNANSVRPSFIVDVAGQYMVHLVVDDGKEISLTTNAQFTAISANDPPIAVAEDRTQKTGSHYVPGDKLLLYGGNSFDPEGQPLIYQWTVFEKPENSKAVFVVDNSPEATFTADQIGHYIVHLVVDDGVKQSIPASLIFEIEAAVRGSDTRPFAEAGLDQPLYAPFTVVQLDGSQSYDVENDPLVYKWELLVKPDGSNAQLSSLNVAKPQFTADILGSYVAKLVVSDLNGDSHFDTVVVTPHENPGLACGNCHNREITRGKPPNHLLTNDDCAACHFTTGFIPPRGTFHAHGHKAQPSRCIVCHDGVIAKTKPFGHIETDKDCNSCHLISNGTWVPALRVPGRPIFSHRGIYAGCVDCHENVQQVGKPEGHMPSSSRCGACHATNVWTPARHLEHTQALGACINCHEPNQENKIQPVDHLKTTDKCLACHTDVNWVPVNKVDHREVIGTCANCHDGVIARGKSPAHIEASTFCDKCHNTNSWLEISATHIFFTGSCVSCHDGIVATGSTSTHVARFTDLCEACHVEAEWAPVAVDHAQVLGTCHGCHDQPNNGFQSALHISTTINCAACHQTSVWVPVLQVDHSEVIGDCIDCHDNVIAGWKYSAHINATNNCEACHSVVSFKEALEIDHNMVIGTCVDCHNGLHAQGQTTTHILTTDLCEACHSTTMFMPMLMVDHRETIGQCYDCHNGVVATGKLVNHIATKDNCEKCHSVNQMIPVEVVNHSQVIGSCVSCHDNFVARGKPQSHLDPSLFPNSDACENCHTPIRWTINLPANHQAEFENCSRSGCHDGVSASATQKTSNHVATSNVCEACHRNVRFYPVFAVNHNEVLGSCADCHNDIGAKGKPLAHLNTTDVCDACHGVEAWLPVLNFDHQQSKGDCFKCHDNAVTLGKPLTHRPADNICENCHAVESWSILTSLGHFSLKPTTCVASGCHTAGVPHNVSVVEDCSSCHIVADWTNWARPTTKRAP